MNSLEALRERREARKREQRKQNIELIVAVVTLILLVVAFGFVGACDLEDRERDLGGRVPTIAEVMPHDAHVL